MGARVTTLFISDLHLEAARPDIGEQFLEFLETEAAAAEALVLDGARRRDAGEAITKLAAMCKYFASEMVGRVADRAVQIHGGAGYIADYPVERFYRDVRLFRIYEGTSQIQQLIIAREMIKEAAS